MPVKATIRTGLLVAAMHKGRRDVKAEKAAAAERRSLERQRSQRNQQEGRGRSSSRSPSRSSSTGRKKMERGRSLRRSLDKGKNSLSRSESPRNSLDTSTKGVNTSGRISRGLSFMQGSSSSSSRGGKSGRRMSILSESMFDASRKIQLKTQQSLQAKLHKLAHKKFMRPIWKNLKNIRKWANFTPQEMRQFILSIALVMHVFTKYNKRGERVHSDLKKLFFMIFVPFIMPPTIVLGIPFLMVTTPILLLVIAFSGLNRQARAIQEKHRRSNTLLNARGKSFLSRTLQFCDSHRKSTFNALNNSFKSIERQRTALFDNYSNNSSNNNAESRQRTLKRLNSWSGEKSSPTNTNSNSQPSVIELHVPETVQTPSPTATGNATPPPLTSSDVSITNSFESANFNHDEQHVAQNNNSTNNNNNNTNTSKYYYDKKGKLQYGVNPHLRMEQAPPKPKQPSSSPPKPPRNVPAPPTPNNLPPQKKRPTLKIIIPDPFLEHNNNNNNSRRSGRDQDSDDVHVQDSDDDDDDEEESWDVYSQESTLGHHSTSIHSAHSGTTASSRRPTIKGFLLRRKSEMAPRKSAIRSVSPEEDRRRVSFCV
ncbi:expressed unknown protein [Seminavis robusta]|uniref:Uncharacterized protein n=1 Tax=Seminavis robusta TaxID=568900 RepID=A0A9N8D4N9_9STRA|nr:expressed unknown protein [Seminavis robusta]|eukprot:Sro3_g002880.1 n/a (595) ;mRNA; f:267631-269415